MTCKQFRQLQDAYLDRTLNGALRLEVDAHRLRCQRCQQRLAVLEAIEHSIASDGDIPRLSEDFTDRVVAKVERRQPLSRRTLSIRVAFATAMMLQAAAVLFFAIVLRPGSTEVGPAALDAPDVAVNQPAQPLTLAAEKNLDDVEVFEAIAENVEAKIRWARASGRAISDETWGTVRYLNIMLPEDVENTVNFSMFAPATGILNSMFPQPAVVEPDQTPIDSTDDVYSL